MGSAEPVADPRWWRATAGVPAPTNQHGEALLNRLKKTNPYERQYGKVRVPFEAILHD